MYTRANRKRSNTKKSSRKTSGTTRNKSTSKKGKVYIPAYKIILLCVSIIALCMVLLFTTNIKENSIPDKSSKNPISQRYEPKESTGFIEENRKEDSKTSIQKKEQEEKTSKQEQKPVQKKQTEQKQTSSESQKQVKKIVPPQEKPSQQAKQTESVIKKETNNFPKAKPGAQLVFVFDDGGQNNAQLEKFLTLPFPVTIAVLPQLANSQSAAQKVRNSGNEVILHQPMQSINSNINPGPGAITPDMNEAQIISQLFININELGPIAGMNNHEGSGITTDAETMAIILQVASDNGIYYLDSRTNVETKVPYVAHELGYSYYERNIFLDNEKTKENALKELKKGLDIANKNGYAIMIGHIWSADFLPALLKEVYPELKSAGYSFTTVSKSTPKK